jgi:kynurenine formamidase
VFRDGGFTESFPLERLVVSGICLRIRTHDRPITARDLHAALPDRERARGRCLLVHTERRTAGSHAYFTRDAAAWMRDGGVSLMGSDTPLYDTGFESPTGFFLELFRAGIPIIANLRNLDLLPVEGFTVAALPLAMRGVATVPCRAIAILDRD